MRVLIRQKVKPEHLDQVLQSLREVYTELETRRPQLRYATHQLDDPHHLLSIVDMEDPSILQGFPVFQRHRAALEEQCDEPPSVTVLHHIADYDGLGGSA